MNRNIETIDMNFNDLVRNDDIEIIEIEDAVIEVIEIEDDFFNGLSVQSFDDKKINSSFLKNVRKKLSGKKIAIISTCCVTLFVSLTGVFMLKGKLSNSMNWGNQQNIVYSSMSDDVNFYLNDESYNTVLVNGNYEEKGAQVFIDGVDYSGDIIIDSSNLDVSKVGVYHVVYSYPISKNNVKTLYRTINVIDNEPPKITLLGSNVYTMLVNDEYLEDGILITDNSNEDLLDDVIIESNVDSGKPGSYFVKYSVSDSSGNVSEVYRTVIVKYSYNSNTNTVLSNSFTDNGVYLTGCVQNNNFKYQMLIKNKITGNEEVLDVTKTSNHYYKLSLDLIGYENGIYEFYLINDNLELLTNNMNDYNRIVRARVGDKLVTFDYGNNKVNMIIEDFEYLYDVVIDPGHGGDDTGAVNGIYYEKNINLEQSLYEKARYEAHGLKVLLLREDDTYGTVMGNSEWEPLDRKGFAVGYYSVVSKITYSNHHNSSTNPSSAGWEILVPASATFDELSVEHSIASKWSEMYIEPIDPFYRVYTKDYETVTPFNKINGEMYSFDDYYAVIRIPNKLFNEKNVIFEGAYVNNNSDMYWYYKSGNWKALSEVKIKAFVESLGVKYIEP